jgi:hypothetical protein
MKASKKLCWFGAVVIALALVACGGEHAPQEEAHAPEGVEHNLGHGPGAEHEPEVESAAKPEELPEAGNVEGHEAEGHEEEHGGH